MSDKFQGVETASQIRYVGYYEQMKYRLGGQLPDPRPLTLKAIRIRGIKNIGLGNGNDFWFNITKGEKEQFFFWIGSQDLKVDFHSRSIESGLLRSLRLPKKLHRRLFGCRGPPRGLHPQLSDARRRHPVLVSNELENGAEALRKRPIFLLAPYGLRPRGRTQRGRRFTGLAEQRRRRCFRAEDETRRVGQSAQTQDVALFRRGLSSRSLLRRRRNIFDDLDDGLGRVLYERQRRSADASCMKERC